MNRIAFGAARPEGWLRDSIQKDMDGCIGHLDELAPDILREHDIYGRDRLAPDTKPFVLGRIPDEDPEVQVVESQFMWWNSESQSNWRDGYVRASLLLRDESLLKKTKDYVEHILRTQEEDGYLGIYSPELRYRHTTENGELWAQSTLFRVLLGYYEATGDQRVKQALLKGADSVMRGYPIEASDPFRAADSFAGLCHGLTIVDAFNGLYRLTGEEKYLDYATWLYQNYSANSLSEADMQKQSLESADAFFKGHGVHTYEHIRAVTIAAFHRPKEYARTLDLLLAKLPYYLTMSGGPIGDEWVFARTANSTTTGYEFCSVLELFDSYALLAEKTGDLAWGDAMEWLYFNAGLGMKHPENGSIMYCKTDNCYEAARHRQPGDERPDNRYMYSPLHRKTAVCCVPNMGRLTPHYVQYMYQASDNGIDILLFGPGELNHNVQGNPVRIRQKTEYPADGTITVEVEVEKPVDMVLRIRKPKWAAGCILPEGAVEQDGVIVLGTHWKGRTALTVTFEMEITLKQDFTKEYGVARGPLLYAMPIRHREETLVEFPVAPFAEIECHAAEKIPLSYQLCTKRLADFQYRRAPGHHWTEQGIDGVFRDGNKICRCGLVPMGGTVLRKTSFAGTSRR